MRIAVVGLAAALAGCTAPPPIQPNAPIAELAGRVAGPAQRCMSLRQSESLQPVNRNTLLYGHGKTIFVNEMLKAVVVRGFVMNHMIHHRGQLSVYLRLRDVPLPSIYGPTADEG